MTGAQDVLMMPMSTARLTKIVLDGMNDEEWRTYLHERCRLSRGEEVARDDLDGYALTGHGISARRG